MSQNTGFSEETATASAHEKGGRGGVNLKNKKNTHTHTNYKHVKLLGWPTWRHFFLLPYRVIPGELDPLVRLDTGHTQELHALQTVARCLRVVVAAHTHLTEQRGGGGECEYDEANNEKGASPLQLPNLAVFLHGAARHLGQVLDKEVVQHVHFPAFLTAYWTADGPHWMERSCAKV